MIGTFNIDRGLKVELGKYYELKDLTFGEKDLPKLDGLIISWRPKGENEKSFAMQAFIVESYARQNIPLVIFDGEMSITGKEYNWLKRFNVTFFEPALNYRTEFIYLPHSIKIPEMEWVKLEDKDNEHDLIYIGKLSDRIKLFEKYYETYASMFTSKSVVYKNTDKIKKHKLDQWKYNNLKRIEELNIYNGKFSVIIESIKNIEMGYIDKNIFDMMENAVVPLLPREHKYFCGMFKDLIVEDERQMDYLITLARKEGMRELLIEDTFRSIEKYYPEFTVEFTCDMMRRSLDI